MRSFVDTNVLVYAVDEADERRRTLARQLLASEGDTFVVSTQVVAVARDGEGRTGVGTAAPRPRATLGRVNR